MVKLSLGYSTMAHRVGDIVSPPIHDDWEVAIVIQNPETMAWRGKGLADLMLREDIVVEEIKSIGVAKSRNRNIWLAKGEYLVFADDDIHFDVAGLERAINFMDENPSYSLLLGMATDTAGTLRKSYPSRVQKLSKFNSARAATYEMIIRVEAIRQLGVWFDEEFGAGARNYLGDEYIFIVDLIKAGGNAVFVPIVLAKHPVQSSGSSWGTEKDRRARAAVFDRVFGMAAPLIRLAFGIRRFRELGGLANLVRFVLSR